MSSIWIGRSGARVLAATVAADFTVDDVLEQDCTLVLTLPGFRMRESAPLFAAVLARLGAAAVRRSDAAACSPFPLPRPLASRDRCPQHRHQLIAA